LNDSWKNKHVFLDIGKAADLELIFAKAVKELPRRLVIVIPEWKERTFYDLREYVLGEFVTIPQDSDSFVESGEVTGFRIWNSWLGLYVHRRLSSMLQRREIGSEKCFEVLKGRC